MASCSRRVEGNVQKLGRGFSMLKTLGDYPQRQCLHARDGLVPVLAVAHDAGQRRYLGEPPAVIFAGDFNRECHICNVPSGRLSNKAMDQTPPRTLARPRRRRSSPTR